MTPFDRLCEIRNEARVAHDAMFPDESFRIVPIPKDGIPPSAKTLRYEEGMGKFQSGYIAALRKYKPELFHANSGCSQSGGRSPQARDGADKSDRDHN